MIANSKLSGMIIAQSPMENTVTDFWKMIIQHRVSAIVMCCGLTEEGKVSGIIIERERDND